MMKPKRKVELPPKFEIAQLIALQLGIGCAVLFYVLKSEETKELFKTIPQVLTILKIINSLFGFCCIILSGGKLVSFYQDIKTYVAIKKKEQEND